MQDDLPPLVRQKLDALPKATGCYLFYGRDQRVLYVGKATVLRQRVRSYFAPRPAPGSKSDALVPAIRDLHWWITPTELDALVLENNLIKEHQPPFNIRFKDDKTYPYLKINWQDPFPRVEVTRAMRPDGARYFGPYTNARAIYQTLEGIRRIFPYLDCDRRITGQDPKPCLYYHLKLCGGPCIGAQSAEAYRQTLRHMMRFLRGDTADVLRRLQARMEQAAANLDFERAAVLRDRIQAARRIVQQQRSIGAAPADEDYVATARDADSRQVVVQILCVRQGRLIRQEHFLLAGQEQAPDARGAAQRPGLIGAFLPQYYARASFVPPTVQVQAMPDAQALLETYLTTRRGRAVKLAVPLRGAKRKMMEMAYANARENLRVLQAAWDVDAHRQTRALAALQDALALPRPPVRMECFDISTLHGTHTVGGMAVFVRGVPRRRDYRKFRIKGPGSRGRPDDFASLREMLQRRFRRAAEPAPPASEPSRRAWARLPDLVVVDGGQGQLRQAVDVLRELDLLHVVPVIALAKGQEAVYRPRSADPVRLPAHSPALQLLQRIRDEAHRFSVAYHRQLRGQSLTRSVLDDVPGVGPARRKQLLIWCEGHWERLRRADVETLARIPGMNRTAARAVQAALARAPTTRS